MTKEKEQEKTNVPFFRTQSAIPTAVSHLGVAESVDGNIKSLASTCIFCPFVLSCYLTTYISFLARE